MSYELRAKTENNKLEAGGSKLEARNIKLLVEYDGTDFCGSQLQKGVRTVQGEMEAAAAKLLGLPPGERCKISFAGRTDTGVHATGQVANFHTSSRHSLETFRRGLNALLPFDLSVLDAEEVAPEFHARFSAKARTYRYKVLNRRARSPMLRRFTCSVAEPLDVAAMQDAANRLIGEHDFASFAGAGWGVPSEEGDAPGTVRRLTTANWFLQDLPGEPQLLVLELAANAFLPHMVRNIVGTLLQVGKGERTPAEFEAILAAKDRRLAGPTAPASGLALVNVTYEESKDRIERTQSPVG